MNYPIIYLHYTYISSISLRGYGKVPITSNTTSNALNEYIINQIFFSIK